MPFFRLKWQLPRGKKAMATNVAEIACHILSLAFESVFLAGAQKDNATSPPMISRIRSIISGVRIDPV